MERIDYIIPLHHTGIRSVRFNHEKDRLEYSWCDGCRKDKWRDFGTYDSFDPLLPGMKRAITIKLALRRWIRRFRARRAFAKNYFLITRRLSKWAPCARPRMGYGYL